MKYRYVITNEGIIEAATLEEAEVAAFDALEFGAGIYVCEIEPLPGEARRMGNEVDYYDVQGMIRDARVEIRAEMTSAVDDLRRDLNALVRELRETLAAHERMLNHLV